MEDTQPQLPKAWENVIGKIDWQKCLKEAYGDALDRQDVFPQKEKVFKALELCSPEKVKVVIIGQDPYFKRDKESNPFANGLAFGTDSKTNLPRSLGKILRLAKGNTEGNHSLVSWAKQGVLLLNTALSVREGKAGSQMKIWENFTQAIINYLMQTEDVCFICWGEKAREMIGICDQERVFSSCHPAAPLKAGEFGRTDGRSHFELVNEFLKSKGIEVIDWMK